MRIFAGTFYWVALLNRGDSANRAVLEFSRKPAHQRLITTDEVLDGGNVHAIPQSRAGLLEGLALYKARPDKGYRLTDCTSMQAMRREGLADVLTNDRHFEQEGFRAMFRST